MVGLYRASDCEILQNTERDAEESLEEGSSNRAQVVLTVSQSWGGWGRREEGWGRGGVGWGGGGGEEGGVRGFN